MEDGIWTSVVVNGREKLVSEISTLEVAGKVMFINEDYIEVEDPRTGNWVMLGYDENVQGWCGQAGNYRVGYCDLVVYND